MFRKETVIDGKGHIMGRLASHIAKQLLSGHKIIVVRCEKIVLSGSAQINRIKFMEYLNKSLLSNPRKGHKHFRSPARVFFKAVRGMLPRKTARGEAAMSRLKVFEGVPHPYDTKKKMIVTDALSLLKLKKFRPYTTLAELCIRVGWKHRAVVDKLENKRKERAKKYYLKKKDADKLREQKEKLKASTTVKEINDKLAKYGYQSILTHPSICLLYTSPSPRDLSTSRMPSSA
eukprot:TRINITY_DN674_c0_g1_i5.p1 TRINITY_DN674_c0_g1~~TRINITY_DN674_c0_g1_i5.p1  ORF type:complete len:232 (-),score=42.45 TRINITY_DN674_c0_g1_i5:20-715(-)